MTNKRKLSLANKTRKKIARADLSPYYMMDKETVSKGKKVYYNLYINPMVKTKQKIVPIVGSEDYLKWVFGELL